MNELTILFEDNHLLVVDKAAGIATMGAEAGLKTVHSLACDYLRVKYQKPGRVFVGIVSRLDSMTTGVLILARTSKSASRLTPQFSAKASGGKPDESAAKLYLAVVEGNFAGEDGVLVDHVRKDDSAKRMRVVQQNTDTQVAKLRYTVVGRTSDATILAIELVTGRKHQIRVQFADRGHPVFGDVKYGSKRQFAAGIALHSWDLRIFHPTLRGPMWFVADPPKSWKAWSRTLGDLGKLRRIVHTTFQWPSSD